MLETGSVLISQLNLPVLRKVYLNIRGRYHDIPGEWDHQSLFSCIASLQVVQLQFEDEPMSQCWLRNNPVSWTLVTSQPDEWKYFRSSSPPSPITSTESREPLAQTMPSEPLPASHNMALTLGEGAPHPSIHPVDSLAVGMFPVTHDTNSRDLVP